MDSCKRSCFTMSQKAHTPHDHTPHTHLGLIFQIFPDLASSEVPNFNKTISTTSNQVLTIRREGCTLRVRFCAKLDCLIEKCRIFLFF